MRRPAAVAAVVAGLVLALGACSGEDAGRENAASSTAPPSGTAAPTSSVPEGPFGPGCPGIPPSGPGSLADMAQVPVLVAAGRSPQLTALAGAAQTAHLADSLNVAQDVTVLAPANLAFDAIPAADRQALLADTARLTALLTHHVIQGRVPPDQLAGTHTTLNNDEVTIEGSGTAFTVAGTVTGKPATVLCGNVPTANATVYVIDQVLAPPG